MSLTTIELNQEEVLLFVKFREYQTEFKTLLDNGVFSNFIGQKILHKNGLKIAVIETRTTKRL